MQIHIVRTVSRYLPIDPLETKTQSQENTVTICSSLVSVAIVNKMVKNNLGMKGFVLSHRVYSLSSRKLEQELKATTA